MALSLVSAAPLELCFGALANGFQLSWDPYSVLVLLLFVSPVSARVNEKVDRSISSRGGIVAARVSALDKTGTLRGCEGEQT